MDEPTDVKIREELLDLYSQLHLACGRAAAALRLSAHYEVPDAELMLRFEEEEHRAASIWARIRQMRAAPPKSPEY